MVKLRICGTNCGGLQMKFKSLLFSSVLLLSACSVIEDQPLEQETENVEEQTETEAEEQEEVSWEEQMVEKLPETASLDDWNLVLVGPWNELSKDFKPELVEVNNQQEIDARIESAWDAWYQAALEAGHRLFFASGYRSIELQEINFDSTVQQNINAGMSEEEAIEKAKEYLTVPGHSEHHTGLALDIVDEEWIVEGNGLDPEYETQASQQWLVDTMTDFGFILRYPENKEEVTGILYEPWHFRYVGKENAKFIVDHELALEEYIDLLTLRDEMNK